MIRLCIVLSLIVPLLFSCAPTIYFIDRPSVMELESSGPWPDLEKEILLKNPKMGTTLYSKDAQHRKKKQLYKVLNGELVTLKK